MKTWMRADVATLCGGVAPSGQACPHQIAPGEPLLAITIPGVAGRRLVRCATCAGEAVPDLPPLIERQAAIAPMVHIRTGANALPLDFRRARSGEREPGCDDN